MYQALEVWLGGADAPKREERKPKRHSLAPSPASTRGGAPKVPGELHRENKNPFSRNVETCTAKCKNIDGQQNDVSIAPAVKHCN
jgi:hypothetical protein